MICLPEKCKKGCFTMLVEDNIDRNEETLTGTHFLLQKIAALDIKKLLYYITVSDYYINLLFDFYLKRPSFSISYYIPITSVEEFLFLKTFSPNSYIMLYIMVNLQIQVLQRMAESQLLNYKKRHLFTQQLTDNHLETSYVRYFSGYGTTHNSIIVQGWDTQHDNA